MMFVQYVRKNRRPVVNLSCKHKFCYLCLKETVKHGDYKCPICRADIPQDFAENAV